MTGLGIKNWNDGRFYQGQFKNNKRHGYGIYHYNNGQKYLGTWANGKRHGFGKQTFAADSQKENVDDQNWLKEHVIVEDSDAEGDENTKEQYFVGVWEQGIRLTWLKHDQIEQIKTGQLTRESFF